MHRPTEPQLTRHLFPRSAFVALGALLLALGFAVPAVAADEAHPFLPGLSKIEEGEGNCGVTVDSYGNVYRGSSFTGEVEIIDASGAPITSFAPVDVDGEPIYVCRVAVDSEGNLYVNGYDSALFFPQNRRVVKFKPEAAEFPPTAATEYEVDTEAGDEGVISPETASSVAVDPVTENVAVGKDGRNESQKLVWPSTGPTPECPSGKQVTLTYVPTATTTDPINCSAQTFQINAALEATFGPGTIGVGGNKPNLTIELDGSLGNQDVPVGMLKLQGSGDLTLTKESTAFVNGASSSVSTFAPDGTLLHAGIGAGVGHANYEAVAFDGPAGTLYALDTQNRQVAAFDGSAPTAVPVSTIDGTDSPEFPDGFGVLEYGELAVDQSSGNVLVTDVGLQFENPDESHGVISEFTSEGEFVSQIGPKFGEEELEILSEGSAPLGLAVDNGTESPQPGTIYAVNGANLFAFGPTSPAPAPQVLSIDPGKGQLAGGTSVTITGRALAGADEAGGSVEFGDVPATGVSVNGSGTQLTAVAPSHAGGDVHIAVTTSAGASAETPADVFTYFGTPAVTAVAPDKGPLAGGQQVTIEGDNLEDVTEVKFGSVVASPASFVEEVGGTKLKVTSPAASAAGTVQISVATLNGGAFAGGAASEYTYFGTPAVTAVAPDKGPLAGGQQVTIEGDNLEDVTEVKFGSVAASSASFVEEAGGTKLKVTSPAASAAGTVQISVATPGGSEATTGPNGDYTYVALPTVIAVAPGKGPLGAGQEVTIEGTDLTGITEVKFGTVAASPSSFVPEAGGTKLKVTSPPGLAADTVDVRVANEGGTSPLAAGDVYEYVAPLTLNVKKAGAGAGTVTCDGGPCASTYPFGSSVSLVAVPDAGSTFAGWSGGGCTDSGACTVVLKSQTTVTATFNLVPPPKGDGGGGGGQTPPPLGGESAPVEVKQAAAVEQGKALLSVSCPGPGSCSGKIELTMKVKVGKKTKTVVVGSARYEVSAGGSVVVKVKLSGAAKKRLHKQGRLKVRVGGDAPRGSVTLKVGG